MRAGLRFLRRNKFLVLIGNQTTIPRTSSPWPSQCTDCALYDGSFKRWRFSFKVFGV